MTSGQIGRYQLHKQIGRGGMARVFLATDPNFRREVAVKLIDAGLTSSDLQKRFENEARVVANLEHYAIVPVYDFGVQDGTPFMVMRLMTGGTLEDRLKGPLPLDEIKEVMRRICAALDKAHENKIVHRDLKPGNIMYDDQGVPYLADFGIARLIEGTQTRSVIGTPSYMSPEQARGEDLDPRTDVYQMGVILYEMLTGHRPFEGETITELVMKHVMEPVPPLSVHTDQLPDYLEDVIQRAMAKNPADRPPGAGALYQLFLGEQEPSTPIAPQKPDRPPTPTVSSEVPTPKNSASPNRLRWLFGALGFAALVAVALLAFNFFNDRSGPAESSTPIAAPPPEVTVVITQLATPAPAVEVATQATSTATSLPTAVSSTATPVPPTLSPTPLPFITMEIGRSVNEKPIEVVRFGNGARSLIFIGGLHAGFAPATVDIANQLIAQLTNSPESIPANVSIYIIPNANPDSPRDPGELVGRLNAHEVDLNRNWPCDWVAEAEWAGREVSGGDRPFSEPETSALAAFIDEIDPVGVIFWEARSTSGLVSPGGCEEVSQASIPLAQAYADGSSFSLSDFENVASYDVNGDGTNWLDAQGVPAAAVLLRGYSNYNWSLHWQGIRSTINHASRP